MTAYFDGDGSPFRVQNMKGVVVDIGHRLLFLDVVIGADIPHGRLGPADQDEKQSLGDGGPGEIVLGNVRSRVSQFMNTNCGYIEYNGKLEIHNSLLNVVLYDKREIGTKDASDQTR